MAEAAWWRDAAAGLRPGSHRARERREMRRGRWAAGGCAVLAVATTLAACGGKSDDASGGGDGGDKIKIGVTIERTGPVPVLGTAQQGIEAAAKRINKEGGIDGKQIELVIRDNAGDPSK